MKVLFFLISSCIIFQSAAAQNKLQTNDYKQQLRINPLGVLNPFETNLSVGYDVRVKKILSVGGDVGVYLARDAFSRPLNGFFIRPALRLYSNSKPNMYSEIVVMYKHTVRKENGWLGMDCVNGVPSYEKFDQYKNVKDVFDISFRFGFRERWFHSKNWFFECYMGLGVRQKILTIKYEEKKSCITADNFNSIGQFGQSVPGSYTVLSVPLGIRFTRTIK